MDIANVTEILPILAAALYVSILVESKKNLENQIVRRTYGSWASAAALGLKGLWNFLKSWVVGMCFA